MKIIIDTEVPFIKGVFEPYAEVEYLFGSEINPETIKDADALIVKGHTRCDAALLEGSAVKNHSHDSGRHRPYRHRLL